MAALIIILILFLIVSDLDYHGFGKYWQLLARTIICLGAGWVMYIETDMLLVCIGTIFFYQDWIWSSFTGIYWYKSIFALGTTKKTDKLKLKIMPSVLWWWFELFAWIGILSVWINNFYG